MATRLDAPGVRPLPAVDGRVATAPVGDARQQAFQRALQNLVGQTVSAQVLSKFNDGSYLVRVADTNARMLLPSNVQAGTSLPLTVVAADPRPTLQIGAGNPNAGEAAVLYTEGKPLPPMAEDTARLPSQDTSTLSQAGRQAAQQAAQGQTPGQPGAAGQPGVPPQAAQLAQAGQQGAAQAGLPAGADAEAAAQASGTGAQAGAQAAGTRPQSAAATLLSKAPLTPSEQLPPLDKNTPQPTLSPAARAISTALSAAYTTPGVPVTINGKTPLSDGGPPDTAKLDQNLKQALGDSGLFYESHVAEWAEGKRPLQDLQREPQMQRMAQAAAQTPAEAANKLLNGPDLSAAQMINQQLHTQEQGKVIWQGQAWPGQPMQWEIERDRRDGGKQQERGGERESEPVWRSGVRFRFPMLGKVGAKVTMVGEQVHIQVESGSEDTAATLRAWASMLQGAMDAAGAPLASLTISAEAGDGQS
ncbi:flagellar hook-length control protein FliK [Pseudoduganella sp. RAF19]|uniref:flagellar hook-length control protein FliK n=1 Tax=Pseudoduganella sp. RAF19 TaxID=3233052 RepID=UPI003F9B262B